MHQCTSHLRIETQNVIVTLNAKFCSRVFLQKHICKINLSVFIVFLLGDTVKLRRIFNQRWKMLCCTKFVVIYWFSYFLQRPEKTRLL